MRRLILIAGTLLATALAQTPRPFVPPTLKGDRSIKAQEAVAPTNDPVASYTNPHEAALAALKTAAQMDGLHRSPDKVINLLLIAAKRDPVYSKAVYDLGIMCARGERWEDAINFYNEVAKIDPDPQMAKLAASELERVQLLSSLEATADGKRKRRFDTEFLDLLNANRDAAVTLDRLVHVIQIDAARWEGLALKGRLEASLGHYAESAHSLESASRLAPAEQRQQLLNASTIAKQEAVYEDSVRNGDLAMERKEYETAGKLYASAWETSPARVQVGMQAAVSFLMDDKVSLAVQILLRLARSGVPEYSQKATAMLKELTVIAPEAAKLGSTTSEGAGEPEPDTAKRIEKAVGELISPKMKLTTKPVPPLLDDSTSYTSVPDVELSKAGETTVLSAESIFAQYRRVVPLPEPPPAPVETPVPPPAPEPTPPEPARPAKFDLRRPSADVASTGGQAISSQPSGALVIFDDNTSLSCTTPCSLPLPQGRHTLKASLAGHRDAMRIFAIDKAAPAAIDLALEQKQGVIYIDSKSPGAAIYVDGKKTSQVTPAKVILSEGDHEVGIEIDGSVVTKSVKIMDGDGSRLTIQ